ncbi:hypothetical protein PTKIN_Ptkin06aG0184100 [Pterospermum kingtungense]
MEEDLEVCPRIYVKVKWRPFAHAIRGCEFSRRVWDHASFLWDIGYGSGEAEAVRFLYDVQKLPFDKLQQFSIMAWVIWTGRDQEMHGERRKDALASASFALNYIKEYNDAQLPTAFVRVRSQTRWEPPLRDIVKVNFDGALRKNDRVAGVGVVIRNARGEVMGALAAPIKWVSNPMWVEAIWLLSKHLRLLRMWALLRLNWRQRFCWDPEKVIHQKPKKTLDEISHDLCPVLSIQQLYRISTMYWDDKYGTHSVSPDVIANMRVLMTEDSNNAVSNSFLLDDDSSIPFSVDDISKSMEQIDIADIEPPPLIRENSGFSFLLPRSD